VNTTGPIRQLVEDERADVRRYLVVAPQMAGTLGAAVQVQGVTR
jgi:hypothetical protein